jgi:type I restriction enzyme S subunit
VNEDFYNNMNGGKVEDYDIMLYKDGAYIGKKTMFGLGFPFEKCCINEHVFIVRTNIDNINQFYLYFYLNQYKITEKIIHLNTNSAQPGINKESLRNLKVLLPDKNTADQYKITIQPLVDLIFKKSLNSKQLSELRDSLLPRLMSGKMRVKKYA